MYGWDGSDCKEHHFKVNEENAKPNRKVFCNILECVGNTPLVRLNKIPKEYGLECEIYAKCEFLNPAGSIKDRVGLAMLRDAESHGVIHDDTIFVEPTSGNTGIAVGYVASLRGNDSIIITSVKNSDDKVNTMRLIGSNVIQIKETESSSALARKIKDADPKRVIMLNQFDNDVNPRVHYEHTSIEIADALGDVDMVVMGAGTGGTMSGVGHRLKERNPKCLVIAAEPDGSTMFNKNGKKHSFLVEGIGGSKPPIVVDATIADGFEVVTDEEAFLMARDLSRKEGMLCGGSSGVAMMAALKAAKRYNLKACQRVVVILPDGIRNYMTKFVSDQWMEAYRFLEPPEHTMKWWKNPVSDIRTRNYPVINIGYTCSSALRAMKSQKKTLAIVVDGNGYYVGIASKDGFRNYATNPTKLPMENSEEFDWESPVTDYMVKHVHILALNSKKGMPSVGLLSRVLDITPFVLIGNEIENGEHFVPKGIATSDEVLDYIYQHAAVKSY
ncbi:cystathionine beta-synthase-like [Ostrinia nubilalis]|uniref:uncharacterized protein LOC114351903 n=1 Tax=Ostrinia furnacalis TaxID=93504 RepID=UPI00103BF7FD|nr:uncharacterized protein LOC114351903 [Ostrinia furnacalis]